MGGSKSRNGGFASDKVGKDGLTGRERAVKYSKQGAKDRWKGINGEQRTET